MKPRIANTWQQRAEDYHFQTPYAYAANNPVNFMDYMGMGIEDVEWDDVQQRYVDRTTGDSYGEYEWDMLLRDAIGPNYDELLDYVKAVHGLVDNYEEGQRATKVREDRKVTGYYNGEIVGVSYSTIYRTVLMESTKLLFSGDYDLSMLSGNNGGSALGGDASSQGGGNANSQGGVQLGDIVNGREVTGFAGDQPLYTMEPHERYVGGIAPVPNMSRFNPKDLLKSARTLRKLIRKGIKPKSVIRLDIPDLDPLGNPLHGQKPHIHLKDKRAFNLDGTWKHGDGDVTNEIIDWLIKFGL